jgi:hypothetical protein
MLLYDYEDVVCRGYSIKNNLKIQVPLTLCKPYAFPNTTHSQKIGLKIGATWFIELPNR